VIHGTIGAEQGRLSPAWAPARTIARLPVDWTNMCFVMQS
jgi:hypothetical protein